MSGSTNLRAGFSEIGIAPQAGASQWPLYGRVALLDDGERRAAIVALDLVAMMPAVAGELRAALGNAVGLAAGDILVSCTHQHGGPQTAFVYGEAPDEACLEQLQVELVQAMAAAAGRLEPIELHFGSAATDGLTFNRRPLYAGDEVGTHGPMWVEDFVRLEGPADGELQLLIATRANGSIAGGLVGFACHPHILSAPYSADFPGALTEKLAQRHGGTFLFLQGASGNLSWQDMSVPRGWWPEPSARPFSSMDRWGGSVELVEQRANALLAASEAARFLSTRVEGPRLRVASGTLEITQRSPTREQVELAYWFLRQNPDSVDAGDFNRQMTGHRFTFYDNTFLQETFARETIGMWWRQHGGLWPPLERVEVQAIAIGGVAFVGFPAELFTEFGLRTKMESPFPATVVCSLANGWVGYVPTVEAFEHGGYETRLAYSSRLVPEAGDMMTDAALELLGELA